jgi:hypothetical protein
MGSSAYLGRKRAVFLENERNDQFRSLEIGRREKKSS